MSSYIFKIGSTTYDLGTIKNVTIRNISDSFTSSPIVDGEKPIKLKTGETYQAYILQCRKYDNTSSAESNFNTFKTALTNALKNITQCYFYERYATTIAKQVVIDSFDINDSGGLPGIFDFTLTITIGNPAI